MIDYNLVDILKKMSVLLLIKGENEFKASAYSNAAKKIINEQIDIYELYKQKTISELPGFGKALNDKITQFYDSGKIEYYEKLKSEYPDTLYDLTQISGLGVKKVKVLFEQYQISNLDDLEQFCINDSLSKVRGFTEKSQEQILISISHKKAAKGKFVHEYIINESEELLNHLQNNSKVERVSLIGQSRRFAEVLDKVEILISSNSIDDCNGIHTLSNTEIKELISAADFPVPVIIKSCNDKNFASCLFKETGSIEFVDACIEKFMKHGTDLSGNPDNNFKNEFDIFSALNMSYIEPELRESKNIITQAETCKMPQLVDNSDLKAMIHIHSNWSDGKNTIKEMALQTQKLGFEYLIMCDHSRSAAYVNGLSIEKVAEQVQEIEQVNAEKTTIPVLCGIESDILPNGDLDYPEDVLRQFQLVVASVHQNFKMSKTEMTQRIINAIKNPYTDIVGHPSGRLLLTREPYEVDIKQIIDAASDYGKMIEINANPYRLDLSWENCIYALDKKVMLSINPDSHTTQALSNVYLGVKVARKAGAQAKDIFNTLTLEEFIAWRRLRK